MSFLDFLSEIWNFIKGKAKEIPTVEQKILTVADKITNALKTLQSSELANFVETTVFTIIKSVDPALIPFFNGIELYLPKIIALTANASTIISGEILKTVDQQAQDGLQAIQNLKGVEGSVFAGNLATIQAGISDFGLSNNAVETGIVSPGTGPLLAIGQAIHSM